MKRVLPLLFVLAVAVCTSSAFAYMVPESGSLLFSINTDQLVGASGTATGNWTTDFPVGEALTSSGGSPKNDTINGVKWEKNNGTAGDMFRFPGPGESGGLGAPAWDTANPIVCTGATIVAAIKPLRMVDSNWNSIVDIFYDGLVLAIDNQTGQIDVKIKSSDVPTGINIPDQQTTIVSLVARAAGGFTLYVNGVSVLTNTTSAAMISLVPGGSSNTEFKHYINVGRNNHEVSPCFNGNIGDILVYKTELGDTDRARLEADLAAKFHAGASYPAQTITASRTGGGGTISPTGDTTVQYEADQLYTITTNYSYSLELLVDGSPAAPVVDYYTATGVVSHYTVSDVIAARTIAANFSLLPTHTLSGNVTAKPGGGATVSVKMTPSSLPSQAATTDAWGNYTMVVGEGTYYVCASQTGYMISTDQTVVLAADKSGVDFTLSAGRNIPMMEKLLFVLDTDSFAGAVGANTGNWSTIYPIGGQLTTMATPVLAKVRCIKYDYNMRADSDGYQWNATPINTPIATTGATIVAVVKPIRNLTADSFNSIVDIFYTNLRLTIFNGGINIGKIRVRRNNTDYTSATAIPDGQLTIVSLVIQSDGSLKVWTSAWNNTTKQFDAATVFLNTIATSSFTAFVPAQSGTDEYRKWINVGRNSPNDWSTFNGYIGDTFIYKTALSDTDRAILEADINYKTTNIATYNITASATAGGTISPLGVRAVGETDSQAYTITPNFGYQIDKVLVDSVNDPGAVSSGTYTFTNVTTTHTIAASFKLDTVPVINLAALKAQVGNVVNLTGNVTVTCKGSGLFFVGEESYKGCIKVVSSDVVTTGAYLTNLTGLVTVDIYGQYTITLSAPVSTATTGSVIKPLGANNKAAKTDAKLWTNTLRVWGNVSGSTIDDGYGNPITVSGGTLGAGVVVVNGVLWQEGGSVVLYQNIP